MAESLHKAGIAKRMLDTRNMQWDGGWFVPVTDSDLAAINNVITDANNANEPGKTYLLTGGDNLPTPLDWYIIDVSFMDSKNLLQRAYDLSVNTKKIWYRKRRGNPGIWEDWFCVVTTSNIQSGTDSFNSVAGQTVSVPVTFPIAFSASPSVIITPITSTPHKWSVAANIITPTGFEAAVYHENSYNGLAFCWIAVGR